MKNFVDKDSIVRKIWGDSDTILLIFAGASAEFALSKAVDWLYFTGKLPKDPLGRLFSTVSYAREIVFSSQETAHKAIDTINHIHGAVEQKRGKVIPQWAYKDVLFMLVDYSIKAYENLERPLSLSEKEEALDVFSRVGARMGIENLPQNFEDFKNQRLKHLKENLSPSNYTQDLFKQYQKHLGWFRFQLLRESQILVLPNKVKQYLGFRNYSLLKPFLGLYKFSQYLKLDIIVKALILPSNYKQDIEALNQTKQTKPFSNHKL